MIKIMVDSAADYGKDNAQLLVPLIVSIDGKEYKGGIDIDGDKFYNLLINAKEFPKTSQPSPAVFAEYFENIKADGDELIYFCLSSALSGTYQSACIASEMAAYEGIHIIDTKTATHMIGVLVDYAAKLAGEGMTASEIAEKCEALKSKVKVLAGLDTLEYLYKGGRLSKASATVGELARIKPIITVNEGGNVEVVAKALGFARATQTIISKLKSYEIDENFPIYSLYSYGLENCEKLEKKLDSEGYDVVERLQIGSTIGAHVGPGAYAVVFVTK